MSTEKRKKHLERQKKKMENRRNKEEREKEVNKIRDEINKIGLPTETPGLVKFNKILDDFTEFGSIETGSIPLQGFGREIVYFLTSNKKRDIGVMLKHNPNLK